MNNSNSSNNLNNLNNLDLYYDNKNLDKNVNLNVNVNGVNQNIIEKNSDINLDVKKVFEENKIQDLKKFISKRETINYINIILSYTYYVIQSGGIFITSIATSYESTIYIWLGILLNIIATLIHQIEKRNENLSKVLYDDILKIKNNQYIDENIIIDEENVKKLSK